ncbi:MULTISPECIES: bifunctional DNA-binding transcriptional regulator/O6-methylguanine-DNA methyltransferase Ada [Pseudomonas]|uniref:bifunctional DNA-binding transcriptional regulator/O6-methylguanine-DNA methyltransferase Ada n=1 Tax=Pseudomonas TaxID=286 RepID=UPI0002A33768|nr:MULTISPECIES: bifunctional DNA-binding transcriptional regulator/O6-methylguanine-DNA methyltransferase Ada [Pseudomonas]MBB1605477.1 AraC family transcriptional regulator [Pseudomonas sp. UMC76]MBB1641422.1 AraC family transcriptional regulator [Pseudomonas sp. UME83]NTX89459.1 bifunctional DNA-binding transcriptional regulator/O6-methylguanine-DNA methyltransferase Ada [Pseudomonas sp. UMA643]NTY19234.1 bifunctional DNA-binding transcriptional regulator/O6-methylguanine-DNA methyltransfera
MPPLPDDERCWQAVCERDAGFDQRFVFSVRSTGVYCRPSCPARRPSRANVRFHADAAAAEAAGFRPCKRCTPDGESPAQRLDALVAAACQLLEQAERPLTMDELAARIGLSASHLARAFKARTGLTPRAWAEARRQQRLAAALPQARSVLDAALEAGYSGTRALYEAPTALSPAQRRQKGAGTRLRYAIAPCPLGQVLLAASPRGVCALLFGDAPEQLEAELRQRFAAAELQRDDAGLGDWLGRVLRQLEQPERAAGLPLDLHGSAFQLRVWRALAQIPSGQTRRYGELAEQLHSHPRAIARACASNPVGLLVPCHRVVAADGGSGGYRWGLERKRELLRREDQAAQQDEPA